jgi:hypothetical protein
VREKPPPDVPLWRWAVWYVTLGVALVLFYGVGTPIWFGLRALAWAAEFRARRRGITGASSGQVRMR